MDSERILRGLALWDLQFTKTAVNKATLMSFPQVRLAYGGRVGNPSERIRFSQFVRNPGKHARMRNTFGN